MVLHLGLDRPSPSPSPANKAERVLIWGASSAFGALAVQLASQAGYTVVGVASGRNAELAKSLGAAYFVDRTSASLIPDTVALGPYKTVLAAADSAGDQIKLGEILAAQGGGHFLSTMGVRPGVELPPGVTGTFSQFIDDYLDPKHSEFTEWVWWNYLEDAFVNNWLKPLPIEVKGGLSQVQAAWDLLREGQVSGRRLVIQVDSD